jgi:predicted ATPase
MNEQLQGDAVIRTPDQRLRIFVSSTLGELADERRAVSRAITTLRLTPVMFELGARPHPPQELYRAYLAQSDVFIGLYWQSYGRIGAGMQLSALEEEFELSHTMPRLVYVKAPAPNREARLTNLLSRIKQEASYRTFRTPGELSQLVRDDLATLLSERFATARSQVSDTRSASPPSQTSHTSRFLPVGTTSLIGREQAIEALAGLVERNDVRLVTLTGPGGIGKTRLAVAVGERVHDRFDAGTVFVPLATVTDPNLVLESIGRAVGTDMTGASSPLAAVVEQFGDGAWLLILDNLEKVVDAARDLDELLARCPAVKILATSLTVLQLRAEREYPVPPLPLPEDSTVTVDELMLSPAVALFVDRARAVHHDFALSQGNAQAVVEICRRLEGLPLAIELAAARTRLLEPNALLRRLVSSLDALGTGTVDMPERQRTLRATVEWSVGLLDDAERSLLETVAVFVGGWTIEAAAQIASLDEDRALDLTEALARHSLVHLDSTELGPRSRMLETIREFVAERLGARTDVLEIGRRHADYYRALAEQADRPLRVGQNEGAERLETEAGNLAAAVRWYLVHDHGPLPHLFRILLLFWELREHMGEARPWVYQLLPTADSQEPQTRAELLWIQLVIANELGDDAVALAARDRLAPRLAEIDDPYFHAVSQLVLAWVSPIVGDFDGGLQGVLSSLEQLRNQDEPYWTAVAIVTAGIFETAVALYDDALGHLREARDLAERFHNAWLAAASQVQLGNLAVMRGRLEEAGALLDEALDLSLAAHSTRAVTYCLAAFARLVFIEGDAERAALLVGAAEGLRGRVGLSAWPVLRRGEAELVTQLRQALGEDRFAEVSAAGSRLNSREAAAVVRDRSGINTSL